MATNYVDKIEVGGVMHELRDSAMRDFIANDFDSSKTYSMGDLCIYENEEYIYTNWTSSAGEWDATKWTKFGSLSDILRAIAKAVMWKHIATPDLANDAIKTVELPDEATEVMIIVTSKLTADGTQDVGNLNMHTILGGEFDQYGYVTLGNTLFMNTNDVGTVVCSVYKDENGKKQAGLVSINASWNGVTYSKASDFHRVGMAVWWK